MTLLGFSFATYVAFIEAESVVEYNSRTLVNEEIDVAQISQSISTYSKNNVLKACFEAMNSFEALKSGIEDRLILARQCASQAKLALENNPTMSLAWVVIADSQVLEGLENDALRSLENSLVSAPKEGWLSKTRLHVSLKLSDQLLLEKEDMVLLDLIVLAKSRENIDWIAKRWKHYKFARPTIEVAVSKANPDIQWLFVSKIKSSG